MTDYIRNTIKDSTAKIGKHRLTNEWREPHVSLSYERIEELVFTMPIETVTFDGVWVEHRKANAWMDG